MVIEVPFRCVSAMANPETTRRSRGFTIESLIGSDLERNSKRDAACSQPAHPHHHHHHHQHSHQHHPSLPATVPPPPPGSHVSSNGVTNSTLLAPSAPPSSLSPSSSSSSSLSGSPGKNPLTGGPANSGVTSSSSSQTTAPPSSSSPITTTTPSSLSLSSSSLSSSLSTKPPASVEHGTNNYTQHNQGKNSRHSPPTNSSCLKVTSNSIAQSISASNNRTPTSLSSNTTNTNSNNNNNNNNNNNDNCSSNKQSKYTNLSRSPSPIVVHHTESGRTNSNFNPTILTSDTNNVNSTTKFDLSPVGSRFTTVSHHHHYPSPQQQAPLGLVTHSLEKSLLAEEKERTPHHPHSQNQQQTYHHHHHHHSPPIPVSSPLGATGTTPPGVGLHYPLKCVQNTEDYYRGTASGFTPVRLCNHPLGSAVTVAAAAAAAAAAGTAPSWTGVLPPTSPAAAAAAAAAAISPVNMSLYRDHSLINPWMFARCAGYLGHRYPINDGAFLLPPYRKPKRIRTAFSPAQLLQLEEAFEKNHYVVGQERKELAADLKLTETQVKVWFQNRRTKHKRMKAEEEATSATSASTTREEPTSSSRARPKEIDIDPTGMEPIEYDGSDENSDSEPMRLDS